MGSVMSCLSTDDERQNKKLNKRIAAAKPVFKSMHRLLLLGLSSPAIWRTFSYSYAELKTS